MQRSQQQQQQQQQRKFLRNDNDPVDMQQQQNFRMQNNRRRTLNTGRQNHRSDSYNSTSSVYHSRNLSARNGSSQTTFAYRTEQILSRTSSRTIIRSSGYNGHSEVGQHPCSVQQRQPPHRTMSNPVPALQPQPQITRLQQISGPTPMPTNLVGFPCYSIIVPPNPMSDPIPAYLQQQPGFAYSDVDVQSNLQLCPTQPAKYFIPVVQHICPMPGRFLPKIERRKRHHALDIIDPVTQRNIFDSKIENASSETLSRNASKLDTSITKSPSQKPPKCVTRSVVAVPNQIQAAATMDEISQGDEKDLQSLKFIDMLQQHNISAAFPGDSDREVSKVDISDLETKAAPAQVCYKESKATDIGEESMDGDIPYILEFSSPAEESDDIEVQFENTENKTPTNLTHYNRHESSYSSCSDISTTDDTIRILKKKQMPSCGSSSLRPEALSLSSLLSDISSGSMTISSDHADRNYQDDETVDDGTDIDNHSGDCNLGDPLIFKTSECQRYTIKELKLMEKLPASKIMPKVEEGAHFLLTERKCLAMKDLRPSFSRPYGQNQRQGQYMRYKYSGSKMVRRSTDTPITRSNDPPQLNEISNAWRPKKLRKSSKLTPEMQAQEELFQNVRGILNKLTKDKFDVLVEQILDLAIDTKDKIYGVMLLIFEKAIDEPHFSQSYAMLCRRLVERQLHVKAKENTDSAGSTGSKEEVSSKVILFKTALLDKTQSEFFRNVVDQKTKYDKLKPIMDKIEGCQDSEKAAELKALLDEKEKLFRLRSVGTVKFIGELYRMSMLTTNIITNCIQCLLDANCDDKLECLCKLLTTVGEKYETTLLHERTNRFYSLKDTFKRINEIITMKRNCNRVRFMLQDMVDTRNKWLPKLKGLKTKTANDSAESKRALESSFKILVTESEKSKLHGLNYANLPPNPQSGTSLDRSKGKNFGKPNKVGHQEGQRWEALIREKSHIVPPFNVPKLGAVRATSSMPASFTQSENVVLGNSSCFKWHREPKTDKDIGKSMPLLPQFKTLSKTSTVAPLPHFAFKLLSEPASLDVSDSKSSTTFESIDEKSIELCKTTIVHMVTTAIEDSLQDAVELFEKVSPEAYTTFIYSIFSIYLHSGGVKQEQRKKAAEIVLELMRLGRLKEVNLLEGYQRFSEEVSDLILDVPEAWSYIFEFIGPIIESGYMGLRQLWNEELKTARMGKKFLKHLLQYFIENDRQSCIIKEWRRSNLQWTDFLAENEVKEFIAGNNFEFIDGFQEENNEKVVINETQKDKSAVEISHDSPSVLSKVEKTPLTKNDFFSKLESRIKGEKQPEAIIAFINDNLSGQCGGQFIVDLTKFVIKFALVKKIKCLKLDRSKLTRFSIPILKHFVDKDKSFEMAALGGIEELVLNGECPPRNLAKIFYSLFNSDVVHKRTFIEWRSLQGIPMKKILSGLGMTTFYNMLNEEGSSSED